MSNRKKVRLGDLAASGRSVISGPFGSDIGKRFFQNNGVPVIRGNNLTTDYRKFVDGGFVFLTKTKADELNADAVEGDILFTAAGTIGQVGMIPKDASYKRYVISNKQLRFRVDSNKADPDFVYAWLASPWIFQTIKNRNTGSTVPLINLGIIRSLTVDLPDKISEQQKIAAVLSALDAKIECNNRINAELEAMAKTLYDYWFVQFNFPDHNGQPYKSSGGKMVYNPTLKRQIPAGWHHSNILAVADLFGGGTPTKKSAEYWNGDIPFFTPTDADGNIFKFSTKDSITENGLKNSSTRLFEENTVFITARGSVGKLVLAGNKMAMNQSCYAFRSKKGISHTYLFFLVKELINHLKVKSSGSVFDSIVSNDIECTSLIIPDPAVIKKFALLADPVFERIANATRENQHLTQLRDWLLPMLMNGQVMVV